MLSATDAFGLAETYQYDELQRLTREAGRQRAGGGSLHAAVRQLETVVPALLAEFRGEVILPLEVTDDVPPGVVASEKGAWLSTSRTGAS